MLKLFKKIDKTDRVIYALLFLLAFFVVFSSTYNPFNLRRMHVDSSVYITIAQGITRGQLPYRDFVDNKGPLAYLISVPGLLLGRFTGVWITELFLMVVSVFFAYRTALFFVRNRSKYMALFATACAFVVSLAFFSVSAGTEEYSLPFLMISLYIFTKNYFSPQKNVRFPVLIVLGICFAAAVLIRLNMFPLWAGFCLVITVESIIKRRFTLLGKYLLGFCLGIAVVIIPVFFYLKQNSILPEFFNQVVFAGASKGFADGIKQTAKNFYVVLNRYYSFVPLFAGIFWCVTKYRHSNFYAGYTLSYFFMLLFLSFVSGDSHYNMVLVPFFVPALAVFAQFVYTVFSPVKYKNLVFVLFFCVVFSESMITYLDDLTELFINGSRINSNWKELVNTGKIIDKNTGPDDKIISLGINAYIYPFTQRRSVSKYIYQGSGIDHMGGAREAFLSDVLNKKPAIIAIFTAEEDGRHDYLSPWYAPVFDMIMNEYRMIADENGYVLFKLKERQAQGSTNYSENIIE